MAVSAKFRELLGRILRPGHCYMVSSLERILGKVWERYGSFLKTGSFLYIHVEFQGCNCLKYLGILSELVCLNRC